jgi:hypothetical protein
VAHIETKEDQASRESRSWLNRIEHIKSRYLSKEEDYKRARIRHDYNLFAEKTGCRCAGMKVCPICSDLHLDTKVNTYTQEALLSPRYNSLYRRR